MKAVFYMIAKSAKNAVIDTLHHPVRLVVYAFIIFGIVYNIVSSLALGGTNLGVDGDMRLLSGIYLAVLYFISIPIMLKGLNMGSRFFSQSDVNNLFIAPISEKKILIYGIGKQMAAMLFLLVCFISYCGMAMEYFTLSVSSTIILFAGVLLMVFFVQLITILIFCFCNGHRIRSIIVRGLIYALAVYAVLAVIIYIFTNGLSEENLFMAVSQPLLEYAPVVGWLHSFIFGFVYGDVCQTAIYGLLMLATAILSVTVLCLCRLDYYEDVLQKTESFFEMRNSYREGRITEAMSGSRKIKVKKTGINHGLGASAFFFKHRLEGRRRSRFPLFNVNTVVLLCVSVFIATAIYALVPTGVVFPSTIVMLIAFFLCSFMQFFFSVNGDWLKELNKPYIYIVPDSAVKKLIMSGCTTILKPLTDSVVAFAILGLCISANISDIITAVLVYTSFGCVYLSSNMMVQRIVGMNSNRGVFITLYMLFVLLVLIPGILAGFLCLLNFMDMFADLAATLIGLPIFIWNIFISFVMFLFCKNLLNNTE